MRLLRRLASTAATGILVGFAVASMLVGGTVQAAPPVAGTVIANTAAVLIDGAAGRSVRLTSNTVTSVVQPPPPPLPPTLEFYGNGSYAAATTQAALAAPLYLQIRMTPCNADAAPALHPVALVSALTGDSETFNAAETAPHSGLFRILPAIPTADAATHPMASGDGILEVLPNDRVTATVRGCGVATASAALAIDPSGTVFNSKTNAAVAGATVELIDVTGAGNGGHAGAGAAVFAADGVTAAPSTVVTAADGRYRFPSVAASTYRLRVLPPNGLAFPSKLPPSLLPADRSVSATGSYGGNFVALPGSPVTFGVPLDAAPAVGLFVEKTASRTVAAVGDLVDYSVTISNNTGLVLNAGVLHDELPAGFAYLAGSARLNAAPLTNPQGGSGPKLEFGVGSLPPGAPAVLTYRVRIGPAGASGNGVNTAQASSGLTHSNAAAAAVKVTGGAMSTQAYLIGKVYADCDGDRLQDAGEPGLPGVRIYLDDGTYAVTDLEGKYSLYGLTPRTHVAKLDATTLPPEARLEVLDNRNALDPGSRFVDLENGELHKADFAIARCTPALTSEIAARRAALGNQRSEILIAGTSQPQLNAAPVSDARTLAASGVLGPHGNALNPAPATLPATAPTSATPSAATATAAPTAGAPTATATAATATPTAAGEASGSTASTSTTAGEASDSTASTSTTAGEASDSTASTPTTAGEAPGSTMAATPPPAAPITSATATAARGALADELPRLSPALDFLNVIDGGVVAAGQTRVRVKGAFGTQLRLAVNGQDVSLAQVGEQSSLESRGVTAWEYIGIALQPGDNLLQLSMLDAFGNLRDRRTLHLVAPGPLANLKLTAPAQASADVQTPVEITVELQDERGIPVQARTAVTLESTLGEWQSLDLDPKEPGTQVFIEGGVGHFRLLPPPLPGNATLRIASGAVRAQAAIVFMPNLRPMLAAGLIEGVVSLHSLNPGALLPAQAGDSFEREIQSAALGFDAGRAGAAARTSLFLKGKVLGSDLLTLAYDSDKPNDTPLFRDIQPDQFYPVYGDSSVKGFDAQSTGKLYVRLDRGTSSGLYGDFSTQSDNPARVLTQYTRALNGAKSHVENGDLTVDAFLSDTESTQVIDELAANGTSGPYQLTQRNPVANSERVDLITRDRNQPAVVLADTPLSQFTDYAVEPFSGQILFKAAVPSLDANLNPIYIRVLYEVNSGGPRYWVGGLDAREKLARGLTLGGTLVRDTNPLSRETLGGVNVLWNPNRQTSLAAEVAQTQSDLAGTGGAHRLELKHDEARLQARIYAVQTDSSFDNPSSTYAAGSAEYGAKVSAAVGASNRLLLEAIKTTTAGTSIQSPLSIPIASVPETVPGGGSRQGESLALEHTLLKKYKVTGGVRHVAANGVATQALALGAVPTEYTSARVRLDAPVPGLPKANAFLQYEEAIDQPQLKDTTVGAAYQLAPQTRLYATHQTSNSLSGDYALNAAQQNDTTVLGLDTTYMQDGKMFDEYRVGDGIDGRSARAAIGLRNLFTLSPGLGLTTSVQRVTPVSGVITDSATALTAGMQYTASPDWKGSTRVEWSRSQTAETWLASIGAALKINADLTGLARGVYNEQQSLGAAAGSIYLRQQQLGAAYRPVADDTWNVLAWVEHKRSLNATLGAGQNLDEAADLFSTHLNYQPTANWLINGRYGIKRAVDFANGFVTPFTAQLLGARSIWDLDPHWDLGLQYFIETGAVTATHQQAVGFEVGYLVMQNVWLSVGYNVSGFKDADLAGEDYTQRAFYLRLRVKFDENLFKPSHNAAPLPANTPLP